MESSKTDGTVVLNVMDEREKVFPLAPDKAVVAGEGTLISRKGYPVCTNCSLL